MKAAKAVRAKSLRRVAVSERHMVVIAREWGDAEISLSVTETRIAVAMRLDEFVRAIETEMGELESPAVTIEVRRRLTRAVDAICARMKRSTTRIMGGT